MHIEKYNIWTIYLKLMSYEMLVFHINFTQYNIILL